jgi:hypothetical protein
MDSDWLTARWVPTAKAFYVRALRKAAKMACHKPTRINKSTKHKGTKSSKLSHHSPMNLFASPDDGSKSPCNATADAADDSDDPVSAEVQAWAALPEAEVALHRNSLGLVDEFALMSRLKKKFPLHHTVSRQSSSHLSHEGNVERVFSGAKARANAEMRSSMLRLITKTGVNKERYKPTVAAIWSRYQEKYKGLSTYQNSDNDTDCYSSDSSDSDSE